MVTVATRRGVFIEWRWVKMLALALIALMLGVTLIFLLRGTPSERGTQLMVKAFSKRRLIEPRLSGGFKGGIYNPAKNDSTGIDKVELRRAEELIEDAVNDNDSKTQLAYGRLLMSMGHNPDALKQFRKAVTVAPETAEPHNDLGVCLMDRGKIEDALDEFNAALKLKAEMPEALFNRGLCYQRLLLRDAASEDFARLVEVERDRSWVGEIKQRQQAVSAAIEPMKQQSDIINAFDEEIINGNTEAAKQIISQYLEIMLKHAYRDCSVEYLNKRHAGHVEEADRALSELQLIGKSFVETNGDSSIVDLASYLSSLPSDRLQSEASLISRHVEADRVMGTNWVQSQPTFQELAKQFEQNGNHLFQFFSAQGDGLCDYTSGSYASAVRKLTACLEVVNKYGWPYRQAEVYANLGLTCTRMAQDALGLKYCEQALIYCGKTPALRSKILQYKANAYTHLGDIEAGLAWLRESTSLIMESAPQFGELSVNCLLTADLYRLINNHSLAMLYAQQALAFAEKRDIHIRIMEATSFMAVEYARLNQIGEAEEQMKRAFAETEGVPLQNKRYTQSLALTRAAEIAGFQKDFERAVENYNKAEAIVEQSQEQLPLLGILHGRANTYAQAKDFERAGADLKRAISLIEKYFATLTERKNRSDFIDASHSIFDQEIALNIQAFSRGEEAFNSLERSRARTLLDDLSSQLNSKGNHSSPELDRSNSKGSSKPMTLTQVQAALPEDLRLVTYSVTDKGTFIFLVTRSGFDWAESKVTTGELDRLVQDYVSGIKNMASIDEVSEAARKLYGHLIGPVANKINDGKRLCIVPDKALNLIPFAALIDKSDQYLVESFRLTYAPSATVLARCLEESRKKGTTTDEKILAVGNPFINRDKFHLSDIPEAEREARESAALYPLANRAVLTGHDATKQQVRALLPECDIAHLALHCMVNEKTPLLAALVLADPNQSQTPDDPEDAPGTQDDSLLYLNDIYSMNLPRTKLVVLSACDSALGQFYRGEGVVSLVRPFLALRVPTVIASLWSVNSQATAALMIDFHRERKGNNPGAGDALRAAQRRMMRSSSYQHPFYWAAFIVVGSNA